MLNIDKYNIIHLIKFALSCPGHFKNQKLVKPSALSFVLTIRTEAAVQSIINNI